MPGYVIHIAIANEYIKKIKKVKFTMSLLMG